jgi:hypothetical protein
VYPVCQSLTSGNITELPVSVRVPVDGAAGIDGVAAAVALAAGVVVDEVVDELLHAAAVNAIGTRTAAVQAKRILLATGAYSFTSFI